MNKKKKKTVGSRRVRAIRKIDKTIRKKLAGVFCTVVLAFVGLALYITYINTTDGEKYKRQVLSQTQQQYGSKVIPYKRGDIYDRNGTILATSEKVYNVVLDCKVVNTVLKIQGENKTPYVEPTVKALVDVMGMDEKTIRDLLENDETKNSQYKVIKKHISITEKQQFEEYLDVTEELKDKNLSKEEKEELQERKNVKGVWFEEEYLRQYPLNSLACDVIGFTNTGNVADWGIEGYYSSILNGVDGRQFGYYNDNADVEQTIISPKDGNNVVSTIDVNIQQIIRSAIEKFNTQMSEEKDSQESGAENIGVIVMDPNNGEILGMDSNNWYDLNNPRDLTAFYDQEEIEAMNDEEMLDALNAIWRNYCISDAFELGSTVKPMTIAGALESGAISPDDTYMCDGYQVVSGQKIRCSIYPNGHGVQDLGQAIKNSCNDALMQIAEKQGAEDFIKYQSIFNFGIKTGIDLPGEAYGQIFEADKMRPTDLATSSFGQSFTSTMIQEAAAFCSVINGGYYYKPHVVKKITDSKGAVISNTEETLMKQTVSSGVSDMVREYCTQVVESDGTGKHAKVSGYSMGGKTGTAQKIPRGDGNYLVSYIGFAPAENPQVVVYVVVDEPHADYQANSGYAQGITYDIFRELLPYMNIFKDEDEEGNPLPETERVDAEDLVNRDENGNQKTAEDQETTDQILPDGIEDPAVPVPDTEKEEILGGNTFTDNGLTNSESPLTN